MWPIKKLRCREIKSPAEIISRTEKGKGKRENKKWLTVCWSLDTPLGGKGSLGGARGGACSNGHTDAEQATNGAVLGAAGNTTGTETETFCLFTFMNMKLNDYKIIKMFRLQS